MIGERRLEGWGRGAGRQSAKRMSGGLERNARPVLCNPAAYMLRLINLREPYKWPKLLPFGHYFLVRLTIQ